MQEFVLKLTCINPLFPSIDSIVDVGGTVMIKVAAL
ncbi:hypothetical protein LINPERHAP2_LOCUS10588 [Linum perenne]